MTEDFNTRRLTQRVQELKRKYANDKATYFAELSKVLIATARNDDDRKMWEAMLKQTKQFRRLGLWE